MSKPGIQNTAAITNKAYFTYVGSSDPNQMLAKYPVRLKKDITTAKAVSSFSMTQPGPHADLDIFYPDDGQAGACWQGLAVDSKGDVYPIGVGSFWRLAPDGKLLNGTSNLFATGPFAFFGTIDEKKGNMYTATQVTVASGPFMEGSIIKPHIKGFTNANAIAVGRGPLEGKLVVSDANLSGVPSIKIINENGTVSQLASGPFKFAEAVAVAPDGTVYTVDAGIQPARLFKTTPDGTTTVFATSDDQFFAVRGLAVDNIGRVYWTHSTGVVVYNPEGKKLYKLQPPADLGMFFQPMGMQFDHTGKFLYIVENFDCRKMYRYTLKESAVSSFTLINAVTGKEVLQLTDGKQVDVANFMNTKWSIQANTHPSKVGSVVFSLQGTLNRTQTENLIPYALFGDDMKGGYYGAVLPVGDYTLTATPYSGARGSGAKGTPLTVHFKVMYSAQASTFTLVNADTDKDIGKLKEGDMIDLATLPPDTKFNIRTNTLPAQVGSVSFDLKGAQTRRHIENNAPYALFANNKSNYYPWSPQAGSYTLTATPHSDARGSGIKGSPATINFKVVYSAAVTRFTLVNAETDKAIGELKEGDVIDLSTLPPNTKLSVIAKTTPSAVGSVVFNLQGPITRTHSENGAPYTLFSNQGNNYFGTRLIPGDYTLTATPYSARGSGGVKGAPLIVTFKVAGNGQQPCTTPSFAPVVTVNSTYTGSSDIAVGDFNGDGNLDLAYGGPCDKTGILLGKGDGSFSPAVIYPSGGSQAHFLTNADFNKDGKPDLGVRNWNEYTNPTSIGVLLNSCGSSNSQSNTVKMDQLPFSATVERKYSNLRATPNPFPSQTMVYFASKTTSYASLRIYNISGVEVATLFQGQVESGKEYRIAFESKGHPPGVYTVVLVTQIEVTTFKLLLVR